MFKKSTSRKSLTSEVIVLVLLVIVLSCGSICLLSYNLAKNMAVENYSHEAMSIAQTVASSVDTAEFNEIVSSGETNDYYAKFKASLDSTMKNTGALFLYVLLGEYTGSEVTYFTEGQSLEDYDAYGLGVKESVEYFPDVMFQAVDEGVPTQSEVFYSDLYGASVAGYAPIIDAAGKAVGVVGTEFNLDGIMAPFNKFVTVLLTAVGIFCVVFCVVVAIIVLRGMVKPIKALADSASRVSDGDFDVELPKVGTNELGALSGSFSAMISTVNNLTDEIAKVALAQSGGMSGSLLDENNYSGKYKRIAQIINKMIVEQNSITESAIKCVYEIGRGNFEADVPKFPGDKAILNDTIELLRTNLFNVHEEISALVRRASEGNLSRRVASDKFTGGWAGLMSELNTLLSAVSSPMNETVEVLEQVVTGNFSVQMTGAYSGDFLRIKQSVNTMINNTAGYIREISSVLASLSDGDYTVGITAPYAGEFQSLKNSINNIVDSLNEVLSGIKTTVEQINSGSHLISESSQNLAGGAAEQFSLSENLSRIMSEFKNILNDNSTRATSASNMSGDVTKAATQGNNEMTELLTAIEEISEVSGRITSILQVINEIALQTKLLSLNASVEAARAGENGKSFAVVAMEVRTLADRSRKAAEESGNFITTSAEKVEVGVNIAQHTSVSLKNITALIDSVSASVISISELSQEQGKKMQEASKDLERISKVAGENANISQEFAATAEELSSQADVFLNTLKKFKLK